MDLLRVVLPDLYSRLTRLERAQQVHREEIERLAAEVAELKSELPDDGG